MAYLVTPVFECGASYFDADLSGQDHPLGMPSFPSPDRQRYGVDARLTLPEFELLAEYSQGTNDDQDVWSGLAELNYATSAERLLAYTQLVGSGAKGASGWGEALQLNVGFRRMFGPNFILSFQWTHDIEALPGAALGDTGQLQLRYRF